MNGEWGMVNGECDILFSHFRPTFLMQFVKINYHLITLSSPALSEMVEGRLKNQYELHR
jgi:hypothetical protein